MDKSFILRYLAYVFMSNTVKVAMMMKIRCILVVGGALSLSALLSACNLSSNKASARQWHVTTIASDSNVRFSRPSGVAVDEDGNVYVADFNNNRIRRISPDGTVTAIAGDDNAQFSRPTDVAVDRDGNIYVADFGKHRIRKITPEGEVSTFAGGAKGYANGNSSDARFYHPIGVEVDKNGNVYVADYDNNRIRKIDADDTTVSLLAGDGERNYRDDDSGASAQFHLPRDVAVDKDGNIYVADYGTHRIRKITPTGVVSTLAGGGSLGTLAKNALSFADGGNGQARFHNPSGVAVDEDGTIYVADASNHRIRMISPEGDVTTIAGAEKGYHDGIGTNARFIRPTSIALDKNGNLYVADFENNRIRKLEYK